MQELPVITVLADESKDMTINHKLCINTHIVDPLTITPKTLSLTSKWIVAQEREFSMQQLNNYTGVRYH